GGASPPLGRAGSVEFHLRPIGDDVDLAARFANLEIDRSAMDGMFVPPLSGLVDVSVKGGAAFVSADGGRLRGTSGTLREVTISLDPDTGVTARGPVSIDESGFLDAELEITLRNPRELARVLGNLMPESRQQIELGLSALGSGGDAATLPLRIIKGDVSLGFL